MKLKKGDHVIAVIKATEVMIQNMLSDRLRTCQKLLLIVVVFALPSIAWGQTSAAQAQTLRVTGPSGQSIALAFYDLNVMPRETANVTDEKGSHAAYTGVPVIEILRRAGTPAGKDLRGKQMALYFWSAPADGYHAVFALAEARSRIHRPPRAAGGSARTANSSVMLKYPFASSRRAKKRHARWVHNVTSLTVKTAH